MRILVTRPAHDAAHLAALLAARGHEALVAPLMTITPAADAALPLEGARGILLTSANGARALAAHPAAAAARTLPVFAVGDATAAAVREAGFESVAAAGGDVESLAVLVAGNVAPGTGRLVHVAGRDRAGDLAGLLEARGFSVEIAVLYSAEAAERLPENAVKALKNGAIGGVMFYSPRSAALYARLVADAGLAEQARDLVHFALSPAVAEALAPLGAGDIRIAAYPSQDALLALLDTVAAR